PFHGLRSRFGADLHQLVADLIHRLIPGDSVPLAIDELHRIAQPALAMDVVPHGGALAAMRAAIDRAIPIRLLTRPDAVGHLGDDRTAHRAVRAHILAPRHGGAGRRWRAGFGLAHGTDRQASERSEATGEEARSAQEAAAIKTDPRFGRKRRPDRAAADLAMCSPDQHDRVPSLRGVAIDAVKRLHLGRVGPVASLALVREVARVRRIASACGY